MPAFSHSFLFAMPDKIANECSKLNKLYDIKTGAVNIDAFIYNNDFYIIEAGARAGATGIPEIISNSTGNDYYRLIIEGSLNEKIEIENSEIKPSASLLVFSDKSGIYQSYNEESLNGFKISTDYKPGAKIRKAVNGTDRIGQIILSGKDKHRILNDMDFIERNLKLEIK